MPPLYGTDQNGDSQVSTEMIEEFKKINSMLHLEPEDDDLLEETIDKFLADQ